MAIENPFAEVFTLLSEANSKIDKITDRLINLEKISYLQLPENPGKNVSNIGADNGNKRNARASRPMWDSLYVNIF